MICKACNKIPNPSDTEDCFEKALDVLKKHYTYFKNALLQRDLELQQVKERNEKLNKALQLIQKNQHQQPAKRLKLQTNNDKDESWLGHNSSQENVTHSDLSLTDDERLGASNLNVAINSEQLFDTSALSQSKNDVSSSSEMLMSPCIKISPKRNKQRDTMISLKQHNHKALERSKTEWQSKERNSPVQKSWAMKFLEPNKTKTVENKLGSETKKSLDKRLCLSLKKTNPSKMKQSLIHFNKSKDGSFRESDTADDVIDASPIVANKNSKAGRSFGHRSGHSLINSNNNSTNNIPTNVINKKDDKDKTLDDIVFDFSPSKKTDSSLDLNSPENLKPKQLKYDNDKSTDCTSLPNDNLGISSSKSDTSSVVILTPATQDVIFVDDTCNEPEIDTMDLMADDYENLKKFEIEYIQKQKCKDLDVFKKPANKVAPDKDYEPIKHIKKEKLTEDIKEAVDFMSKPEETKSTSTAASKKLLKPHNPLFSSDEPDTEEDDEDFMPKPFIIKQEPDSSKSNKKLTIKQRFNIECEDCEKLIDFLDKGLTDAQIKQHLDKCKRHNNPNNDLMRQNTPKDFWNPFILSFQADDPRNEVLIDNRFKDIKK
ncbi:CTBP-interacting protein [Cochliomyia hominivorax]